MASQALELKVPIIAWQRQILCDGQNSQKSLSMGHLALGNAAEVQSQQNGHRGNGP